MSKKIFIISLFTIIMMSNNVLAQNYDEADLKFLKYETEQEFEEVEKEFESTRFSYGEKIKEYTKALIKAKKKIIKKIKARLKQDYKKLKSPKDSNDSVYAGKKAIYRAFKIKVYREWKKDKKLLLI